jgi:putative membrane protein
VRNFHRTLLATVAMLCAAPVAVTACGDIGGHIRAIEATPAKSSIAPADRSWIDKAHQANMAETQTGRLAELTGGSKTIRSAGAVLSRDHQKLDSQLIPVANRLKVTLPQSMTVPQTTTYDQLSIGTGHLFDHDFTASMMTAQQSMISATRAEIAHGSSARVVKLAKEALPVLEKDLKMLQAAAPAG